jgi:hypothetical protein
MHTRLRSIRILFRTPSSLRLMGVPYLLSEKSLKNTWDDFRDSSISPTGWISLEEPNWGETRTPHQKAEVKAFLKLHEHSIPQLAGEWAVLPPIEVVDAALGSSEPPLLRPGHHGTSEAEDRARYGSTAANGPIGGRYTPTIETGDLHTRIAHALGWSLSEVRSMSFQSLRELVRVEHPKLAAELTEQIRTGQYIVGEPLAPRFSTSRVATHEPKPVKARKPRKAKKVEWQPAEGPRLSPAERERRQIMRAYGLDASDADLYLACTKAGVSSPIVRAYDTWRAQNGYPAHGSPLSRNWLMTALHSGLY